MVQAYLIVIAVFLAAGARDVSAQAVVHGREGDVADWRVGPFVGAAHNSPVSHLLGTTPGRDHLFIGVQAVTPVLRWRQVRLSYAAQILPAVFVRNASLLGEETTRDVAYAWGLSPFGLRVTAPAVGRFTVFGAAAAGALVFPRPYPVPAATRINFTLEFGGGLTVRTIRSREVEVGYKYHHLSNAYTSEANPGLDANVFYAGLLWHVKLPR
jgi:hypothetical protein